MTKYSAKMGKSELQGCHTHYKRKNISVEQRRLCTRPFVFSLKSAVLQSEHDILHQLIAIQSNTLRNSV